MKKAVILLSGGLDSTTCLAIAKSEGFTCYTLSFDYGQRHDAELNAAKSIAKHYQVEQHEVVTLSINNLIKSALTDKTRKIPDYKNSKEIPSTYVPARNTVFLSLALGWAEMLQAGSIFMGVSHVDYSGYPDCRPEYIAAFQQLANLATKSAVEGSCINIATPIIHLNKAETIKIGYRLGVDYSMTVSCYQATSDGLACGRCDSCTFRKNGFKEAGINDPTRYNE